MLGRVCGLVKCFLSLKSPKIMKSDWADRWAAMATKFVIGVGVWPVELLVYQVSMLSAGKWMR